MADNGSTADEQELLQEALRLSLEVNDDAPNSTPDPNRTPQRRLAVLSHGRQHHQKNSHKCLRFVLRLLFNNPCLLLPLRDRRVRISLEWDFHWILAAGLITPDQ